MWSSNWLESHWINWFYLYIICLIFKDQFVTFLSVIIDCLFIITFCFFIVNNFFQVIFKILHCFSSTTCWYLATTRFIILGFILSYNYSPTDLIKLFTYISFFLPFFLKSIYWYTRDSFWFTFILCLFNYTFKLYFSKFITIPLLKMSI